MRYMGPAWRGTPREDDSYEVISNLIPTYLPEGNAAIFAAQFEGGRTVDVRVPIEAIGGLQNILSQAYCALAKDMRWKPQTGLDGLWHLMQSAQRPDGFDVMRDPFNGDLVFLYRFRHQAPMALRVDLATCFDNMGHATRMIRALAS